MLQNDYIVKFSGYSQPHLMIYASWRPFAPVLTSVKFSRSLHFSDTFYTHRQVSSELSNLRYPLRGIAHRCSSQNSNL